MFWCTKLGLHKMFDLFHVSIPNIVETTKTLTICQGINDICDGHHYNHQTHPLVYHLQSLITIFIPITRVFSSTNQMTNFVIGVMVVGRSVIMYDVLYKVVVIVMMLVG